MEVVLLVTGLVPDDRGQSEQSGYVILLFSSAVLTLQSASSSKVSDLSLSTACTDLADILTFIILYNNLIPIS